MIERFFNQHRGVRRLCVAVTLVLTVIVMRWAMGAADAGKDPLSIGAVTAPLAALQGFVFKFYFDNRKDAGRPE